MADGTVIDNAQVIGALDVPEAEISATKITYICRTEKERTNVIRPALGSVCHGRCTRHKSTINQPSGLRQDHGMRAKELTMDHAAKS